MNIITTISFIMLLLSTGPIFGANFAPEPWKESLSTSLISSPKATTVGVCGNAHPHSNFVKKLRKNKKIQRVCTKKKCYSRVYFLNHCLQKNYRFSTISRMAARPIRPTTINIIQRSCN